MFNWRSILKQHRWEEGKTISVVDGSYRTRVVVTCYEKGRQKTEFANGDNNYSAYVELTRPDGTWISQGTNIVPVLPDGRMIMVVEQRPPQFRLPNQPTSIMVGTTIINLHEFGPYSSLEFPGGAVDENEELRSGFLRELEEETEVVEQTALLYERCPPMFAQGSDLALEEKVGVVFLKYGKFSRFVNNDGGLHVFALTPEDVQRNIWAGNIRSGQAALLGWAFYQEVTKARADETTLRTMCDSGYLAIREVHIKRA